MKIHIRGTALRTAREDPERTQVGPIDPPIQAETVDPIGALREASDVILQIFGEEKPNSDLRSKVRTLYDGIRNIQTTFRDVSKLFGEALDQEENKNISADEMESVDEALAATAKTLNAPMGVASLLRDIERRTKDDNGVAPVKHILPKKTKKELEDIAIKGLK